MSDPQRAFAAEPADAEVRLAALDLRRHIIAVAPAGSGKTGLLVQRMLAALATVDTPEQVVAMTFTNKAAAEIRNRVLGVLQRAAAGTPASDAHDARSLAYAQIVLQRDAAREASQRWSLTANPGRLRATTIDGLQAHIAAELPLLSGLGGRPRVVEDAGLLYEDAVLALFAEIEDTQASQDLREAAAAWLRAYGNRADRLIAPFADLLARREQWQHTLAADFDWQAHERQVLEAIHVAAQEHFTDQFNASEQATLLAIVRAASSVEASLAPFASMQHWPRTGAENAAAFAALTWPLLTKNDPITLRKTSGLRAPSFAKGAEHTKLSRPLLAARVDDEALENAARALRELPPAQVPGELIELREALRILLLRLLGHLRAVMGERGETDFVGIAEAARAALRPREDREYRNDFGSDADDEFNEDSGSGFGYGDALLRRDAQLRHLLVDEMQDTSESQLALLRNLTLGWSAGDGRSLFLVGDPQQSIYAFRKAEVRLFQQLLQERRLGELPLNVLRLSANFRSEPVVVDWFNAAFERIFPDFDDALSGAVAYSPSIAARTAAADETQPAAVRVHVWNKDCAADEARGAARLAAAYAAAGGSVAILVRARSHVRATLAELRALGVRAACQDVDPLAELPAVRDVLALARALWHPEDRLAWAVLLRAPLVGLSWADLLRLSIDRRRLTWPERLMAADLSALSEEGRARVKTLLDLLAAINADHARASLPERVEILWTALGGPACVDATSLGDVRRTFGLLREHATQGLADARRFERAVAELYAAAGEGAVQVMTIHKAKGLEFDHVVMVGAGRAARAEDRPLLHLTETPHGPLLVPKPPRHWPQDAPHTLAALQLYNFAHGLHARVRSSEGLRLLYVAATRARRTLDICFCADIEEKTGARKPKSNSFAEALLKGIDRATMIATDGESPSENSTMNAAGSPPRAPRLPIDLVLPDEDESAYPIYLPQLQRSLRPSEAVLSAADDKRADSDIYAQLVGTLFHQALEKISRDGIERWHAGASTRASALAAGFRRLSLPEPQVENAVARVLELVDRTLASATGRWILGPHVWARSEYALAGYRDGRWISALLDRCFETGEGELWIVDYKTSAQPIAVDAIERYIAQSAETYGPQLMLYSELLKSQRPGKTVIAALYFPEGDRLLRYEN
jgi:ATP-dependent exoDNAse (exonuclease V) beta subunit